MQITSTELESNTNRERIPLCEKRLLNIKEFQEYTSVGRNSAFNLAREADAVFRWGKRILVDRVKFDAWCDARC